jgi:hypothetical protein
MTGIAADRDSHLLKESFTSIKVTAWALKTYSIVRPGMAGGSAELVANRSVDRG